MTQVKYRFLILPERRLILKYYQGNPSVEQLFDFLHETSKKTGFDPSFNVLNDLRKANIHYDEKDLAGFVDRFRSNPDLLAGRNVAFLANTPQQTVFTTLLEVLGTSLVNSLRTFSTLEGALRWLGIPVYDFTKIEKLLADLSDSSS